MKYRIICGNNNVDENYAILSVELCRLKLKNFNVRTKPLNDIEVWKLVDECYVKDGTYFILGIQHNYKTAFEYLKNVTFEAIIEEVL